MLIKIVEFCVIVRCKRSASNVWNTSSQCLKQIVSFQHKIIVWLRSKKKTFRSLDLLSNLATNFSFKNIEIKLTKASNRKKRGTT
jgi:hypothetical protein